MKKSMIACRYSKGKNGKYGVQRFPFAVIGDCRSPILHIAEKYRHRFGIESSYRLMNQARARTSSSDTAFRLLLVGIAFMLVNLWIYLNWFAVMVSRRRGTHTMFTAMSLGIVCAQDRELVFSNAAMPYPIVKRRKKVWELEVNADIEQILW